MAQRRSQLLQDVDGNARWATQVSRWREIRVAKLPLFWRDGWARPWSPGAFCSAYMLSHDAHHRGQICLLAPPTRRPATLRRRTRPLGMGNCGKSAASNHCPSLSKGARTRPSRASTVTASQAETLSQTRAWKICARDGTSKLRCDHLVPDDLPLSTLLAP